MSDGKLEPCPFCGGKMIVREHSAFHPSVSVSEGHCWLQALEIPESDYPSWNRRASADRAGVVEEYGWVIEGAWSDPAAPQYWAGSSLWMSDHMCAIRFAREHDAKQAADAMLAGMNVRICEHTWIGPDIRETVSQTDIRESVSLSAPTAGPAPSGAEGRRGDMEKMRDALVQARGALRLDCILDQSGQPYGTTAAALEAIDAALQEKA